MGRLPRSATLAACVVTLVTGAPHAVGAQDVASRRAALSLGACLNVQYAASSVDEAVDDVFLRRARLELDGVFSERLTGRVQADFGGGSASVKDAWVRYALMPSLDVTVGQFKRPFSVFELSSSTDLPIVERDGRIEGLSRCPGVGGVCTFSRLTETLELDDRDLGLMLSGRAGERVGWMASVTNGTGSDAADENDAKSLTGRVEVAVAGGVVLSGFGALHDWEGPQGTERAPAVGADLEVGTWRSGLHLLTAVARGGNWAVSEDAGFTTAQALVSWYAPAGEALAGVEPLLRVSWASVDGSDGDGSGEGPERAGLLVTPGVMLYAAGKNGVSFNLDAYRLDEADRTGGQGAWEWSFKVQSYLYF